ncbi:MAG: hypothetical protein ABR530_05415 [Pyrinomonadaceae bacterium]
MLFVLWHTFALSKEVTTGRQIDRNVATENGKKHETDGANQTDESEEGASLDFDKKSIIFLIQGRAILPLERVG